MHDLALSVTAGIAAATSLTLLVAVYRLRRAREAIAAVSATSRQIPSAENPRRLICEAIRANTDAFFAALFEPDGRGNLVVSEQSGREVSPGLTIALGDEPCAAACAFASGKGLQAVEGRDNPSTDQRLIEATGAVSILFEPVTRGAGVIGVVAAGSSARAGRLPERETTLIRMLAVQAAHAIERSDLIAILEHLAGAHPFGGRGTPSLETDALALELA